MDKKVYEVYKGDCAFPEKLKDIPNPPSKIFAMGNLSLLSRNSISIVGSRNSSEYGRRITKSITEDLVKNDMVIVSGMAHGIDTVAHKTCLENGGKTIAVLGSGFKNIFPKENENLFYEILENDGLVVSEYPIDEPVQKKNFPKRNRIISGLSLGVLVIEAAYRSGTSITAKHAVSQNKKVFCIPNSIGNKNSYGTINLLKSGAVIVSNASDILKNVGMDYCDSNKIERSRQLKILDENSKKIFDCILENEGINADKIAICTELNIAIVNQILTMLEIDEIIENMGMNKFKVNEVYCE